MSKPTPFASAYRPGITPAQVLAFHKARFGDARMESTDGDVPPEQPDGVSDEEWSALGDPGKRAIVRERERATKAESDLAAARASTKPKPAPPKQQDASKGDEPNPDPTDVAGIVAQAVAAALKPFEEREQQREAEQAASLVVAKVTESAKGRLHDASDALAHVESPGEDPLPVRREGRADDGSRRRPDPVGRNESQGQG